MELLVSTKRGQILSEVLWGQRFKCLAAINANVNQRSLLTALEQEH